MSHFNSLAVLSWSFYSVSISLILSRLIFRRIMLGHFKRFQADDWLMTLVFLPYTASTILSNQIGHAESTTEHKYRYVFEEMQMITIWLVKACLLVLYWRIFPVETSFSKRRILQCVSAFCCASFLIVQASLMLWCQPTEAHWDTVIRNPQCTSYHNHVAVTLALNIPITTLVMILPVPFIPTPRRLLIAILLILGTFVLAAGIVSRSLLLIFPSNSSSNDGTTSLPTAYLSWCMAESTLSIVFANLPFLTSLVATAAPRLSPHLSLSQWPRSRQASWVNSETYVSMRTSTIAEIGSAGELEKAMQHEISARDIGRDETASSSGSAANTQVSEPIADRNSGDTALSAHDVRLDVDTSPRGTVVSQHGSIPEQEPTLPSPPVMRPETRDSQVPKMRLSGGLAEMGELSLQDTTQGWPIYWR